MKGSTSTETDGVTGSLPDERKRLLRAAGLLSKLEHYRRQPERPFTPEERTTTTVLFGNLTWKHEAFIKAVFDGSGYRFQNVPMPTKSAFRIGKEYCNNGLCNPTYFTAGGLIQFLENLETRGLSRDEIIDNYVYFTVADCGPCRLGMYESEYRQALENAGFSGFRVITFQNNRVIREGSSEPGLKFTTDLGLGVLNALILGDLLYEASYQIRPHEVNPGDTDRAMEECIQMLAEFLRNRHHFRILESTPQWFSRRLAKKIKWKKFLDNLGKIREHLYGSAYRSLLQKCRERLDQIEVDRTRPKPIVKIVGEFFSHISENDANYNMFAFLEREGAEVRVDSISGLILYWLYKANQNHRQRRGLDFPYPDARWWHLVRLLKNQLAFFKKPLLISLAGKFYSRQFHRINEALGGHCHALIDHRDLAKAAQPFYNPLTRGGEGHLEVGKSIYCTTQNLCHMVLSLKPFGCMPSTQSDGVMAAVTSRHEEILFLSIETSGDGDVNAISRVQMVLADAKKRAQAECERACEGSGKRLEQIRAYIASHPELRRPSYRFPHQNGVTATAAHFILHVSDLMDKERFN